LQAALGRTAASLAFKPMSINGLSRFADAMGNWRAGCSGNRRHHDGIFRCLTGSGLHPAAPGLPSTEDNAVFIAALIGIRTVL